MRTPLLLTLCVALCGADLLEAQRGRRRSPSASVGLEHFSYREVSYDSPAVDGEGVYGLYLPNGYDAEENAERRYPLAIWLHGLRGNHRRFHDGGGAAVLDALRGQGEVPEMIVVAPSSSPQTAYMDGESSGDRQTQITRDLLQHLEQTLRIAPERQKRALMGVSIGGFGAMRIVLQQPDLFGTVAVRSQAIVPATPPDAGTRTAGMVQWLGLGEVLGDPIDPEKWRKMVPAAILAEIDPADLHDLRIYFDAGSADRYGFGPGAKALSLAMKERKIPHSFEYIEGGGHSWGTPSFAADCRKAFEFVAAGFKTPVKPANGAAADGEATGTATGGGEKPGDEKTAAEKNGTKDRDGVTPR